MSKRLAAKADLGHEPLLIWNRTKATADAVGASTPNTQVVTDLEEVVARADIIWSCLTNEAAVLAVYDKILADEVKGKLLVESSTGGLSVTVIILW